MNSGTRAEKVAGWYFRLNQCLTSEFILHSDEANHRLTDADVLGVWFPYVNESLRGINMSDDPWLTQLAEDKTFVFIAEVKIGQCQINDNWKDKEYGCMEKAIERLGFAHANTSSS